MRNLVEMVVVVAAVLGMAGCGGSNGEICAFTRVCPKGGTIYSCCKSGPNGNQCRYKLSDGTSVQCAGGSCSSSDAQKANAWCDAH